VIYRNAMTPRKLKTAISVRENGGGRQREKDIQNSHPVDVGEGERIRKIVF